MLKKIVFSVLFVLGATIGLYAATATPVRESGYDDEPQLRTIPVPAAGIVITATKTGIINISSKYLVYVNLSSTTPNASAHMAIVPANGNMNSQQFVRIGGKIAIIPDSGAATINMTTQSWKNLPL